MPILYSVEDTFDVGFDDGQAVADDYPASMIFPGGLSNIVFDFNAR